MNPIRERLLIWLALLGAIAILIGGICLARRSNDPSWINRSGAAIVCLESLVVLAEFSRRWRIRLIEESLGHTNPYIRREAIKAERRLVIVGVSMAVLGEGVHGFGDLAFAVTQCGARKSGGDRAAAATHP